MRPTLAAAIAALALAGAAPPARAQDDKPIWEKSRALVCQLSAVHRCGPNGCRKMEPRGRSLRLQLGAATGCWAPREKEACATSFKLIDLIETPQAAIARVEREATMIRLARDGAIAMTDIVAAGVAVFFGTCAAE